MLIGLFAVALIPTFVVGSAMGAGAASIVGGLVTLFSLIAFLGGPLRPDLRIAAQLSPMLLFGAVVPRLVGEVSEAAAIALVVGVVFVAALLPLRGPRFATAGLGLGMSTLFAYGIAPAGPVGAEQLLVAVLIGLVMAVVLRIAMGAADPSKPTREKIASVLVDADPDIGAAVDIWLSDGRQRWLESILGEASRFRFALHSAELACPDGVPGYATTTAIEDLRARAEISAVYLRAKNPEISAEEEEVAIPPKDRHLADAEHALDAIDAAIASRDTSRVPLDLPWHHSLRRVLLVQPPRFRSIQLRHAVRTAIAVLTTLWVTSYLPAGDPLVVTALLTTFAIVQTSWRDTLGKAWPRIAGLAGGSLVTAVVLLSAPTSWLTVVAVVALCLGLWNITKRPALGYALMVVVSIGFNTSTRHLDPVNLLVEYAVLTVISVFIGVVVGFAVIPRLRSRPLTARIVCATEATADVLRVAGVESDLDSLGLQRIAAHARNDLTPDREKLERDQLSELEQLRTLLRDVSVLSLVRESERRSLDDAANMLSMARDPKESRCSTGSVESVLTAALSRARTAERCLIETT